MWFYMNELKAQQPWQYLAVFEVCAELCMRMLSLQ